MMVRVSLLGLCVLLSVSFSIDASACDKAATENYPPASVGGELRRASADTFKNIRSADGSLKAESKKMVERALQDVDGKRPAGFSCAAGCSVRSEVIFIVRPAQYQTDYSDEEHCAALLKETSGAAISFPKKSFTGESSVEDLTEWIGQFSQGKGEEGSKLYDKCDKSCSPSFRYSIDKTDSGISLLPSSVCGHARDKSDNNYDLSVTFHYSCG
jgi:hypothetical protein